VIPRGLTNRRRSSRDEALGFFNLKVYIGHPFILEAHAGESDDQAESPTDSFAVTADARGEILEEILTKLATALQNGAETIDVNVNVGAKEILRDPSFPLAPPAHLVRAATEDLRKSMASLEVALATRALPATKKAAAHKPPKAKSSKKKPRNRSAKGS
jgi:hypothetical protein